MQTNQIELKNEATDKKGWVFHLEWGAVLAAIVVGYAFLHNENTHMCARLDSHMHQTHQMFIDYGKRSDEINRRSDELHKEFYDLLKQMNKENK